MVGAKNGGEKGKATKEASILSVIVYFQKLMENT
jgi:hypothetical protein